jgi:AcrR family transcriptional regulator
MTTADAAETPGFTVKGLATRERILRSAAEVLLTDGVSGFNLDKVRQSASVSGSQLDHYFANRQDLIRAVMTRQVEMVLDFHRQPAVGGLDTFDDWERWADLNLRYLRKVGYRGTATYHALAGQLAKSDETTRQTFAAGYWRWVNLLEDSFSRMKNRGLLVPAAAPRQLALVVVALHQGAGILSFTYRQEWPLANVTRFVVNYVRHFATDPAQRSVRRPRRTRGRRVLGDLGKMQPPAFTPKGMATRARIIEGAAELISERGIKGTSLEDVRRAVGVSGSQLSHYFAGKRDLTRQVIAARTDFVIDFHVHPALGQLDSLRSLRAWADLYWSEAGDNYLRNGCVYGSLTGELLEADDEVLDDLAAGYDRWLALFQEGLSAMRQRGELIAEADPRHLATALIAAHQGGALLTHITASAEPFRAAVNAAVDYVGYYAPPTPTRRSKASSAKKRS